MATRERGVPGRRWTSRAYPDGCRICGQTEKRHQANGLCQTCDYDPRKREWAMTHEGGTYDPEAATVGGPQAAEDSPDGDVGSPEGPDEAVAPRETRPGSLGPDAGPTVQTGVGGWPPTPSAQPVGKRRWWQAKPRVPRPPRAAAPRTAERPPGRVRRSRVSAAETLGDLWGLLGSAAQNTGHVPLGRYLQWQGEAAGEMLDTALAHTMVDRVLLQPAVKARTRLDVIVALVGPPAIILAIERDPSKFSRLAPVLKSAIRSSLPTMLPAVKKVKEREAKTAAAIRDLFPELPAGVDPVDLIMEELFAGVVFVQDVVDGDQVPADVVG